jgi:hypothetical protein
MAMTCISAGMPRSSRSLLSSGSVVLSNWTLSLRAARLILLDNPHSTFGQNPLQSGQMKLAQVQHVRLPADARSHRCAADTGAPIIDLVCCASRACGTAIRIRVPACHGPTLDADLLPDPAVNRA